MSKKLIHLSVAILLFVCSYWVIIGFSERKDVLLSSYKVLKENGNESIEIKTELTNSMGYIRGFTAENNDGNLQLTFRSTFGGLNNKNGAKDKFIISDTKDLKEISFNRPNDKFEVVLKRNDITGRWEKIYEKN